MNSKPTIHSGEFNPTEDIHLQDRTHLIYDYKTKSYRCSWNCPYMFSNFGTPIYKMTCAKYEKRFMDVFTRGQFCAKENETELLLMEL
jgi:hypothetical protein